MNNTQDYETLYLCERCAHAVRDRGDRILIGDIIPNSVDDYECDICGGIAVLYNCKVWD